MTTNADAAPNGLVAYLLKKMRDLQPYGSLTLSHELVSDILPGLERSLGAGGREWTDERPKEPGWYWVWQPPEQWPCHGEVHCVKVEWDATYGWRQGGSESAPGQMVAWVPCMDYADRLDLNTWDHALWQGPIEPPAPPRTGE